MVNEENVKERCKKMIEELGIPQTRFAANIGIASQTYYLWQKGNPKMLSAKRVESIDQYLKRYGF